MVSFMNHIKKRIFLRIIMMRVRNKIKPEIAEKQFGFVEGKGKTKAISIIQTIIEQAVEGQEKVYL